MRRILIRDADVVITVNSKDEILTRQSLVIEDDRIVKVGPAEEVARAYEGIAFDEVIEARGFLVMPGLVDAHVHLSEQLARGVFPDDLSTRPWVFNWAKPLYAAMEPEDEYVAAMLAGIEMIKTGTTCCLDMGAQSDLGSVVRALERVGLRAITGRHAADRVPERLPPHWSSEMVARHFFPSAQAALEELERCVCIS
jgi:cytosine/adenosine deaminase-related metal-dependent hydrolase